MVCEISWLVVQVSGLFASNSLGSFAAEVSLGAVVGALVSDVVFAGVAGVLEQPLVVSRRIRAVRADP